MRAGNNRTIALSGDEREKYLSRCVRVAEAVDSESIIGKTLIGDSLGIMPHLPEGFADLIIADPPYNLRREYAGTVFRAMEGDEYEAYTKAWLDMALLRLKDSGSIYACCDWKTSLIVGPVLAQRLKLRSRITWQREKGRGSARCWKNSLEDVWFATKGDDYYFDIDAVKQRRRVIAPYKQEGMPKGWQDSPQGRYRDTCPSNFWDDITVPYWSMRENTEHPTQKSEKLMAKLILASCPVGGVVFDPFLGSGTSSVTAKKLSRRYCGIEREPEYCALAEKRIEEADTQSRIQGYEDGVFWERNSLIYRKLKEERHEDM